MPKSENIINVECDKLSYETGDFIYVICGPDEWKETTVRTVVGEAALLEGKMKFFQRGITAYNLFLTREYFDDTSYFLEGVGEVIPFHRIFKTAKEATLLSQFKKVKGIIDEEWISALGDREEPVSLEKSELGICCAAISEARDILYKCRNNKGLIQLDINYLQSIMISHGMLSPCLVLNKIFEQLGVEVESDVLDISEDTEACRE